MNTKRIIIAIIGLHVMGLFVEIYKQNSFVRVSFENQKLEKQITQLNEQKKRLTTDHLCLARTIKNKKVCNARWLAPNTIEAN